MTDPKDFQKINFGYASAQQEGMRAPDLLINGYLDLHEISENALSGPEFLVLGYKGSGKSAISERLRLLYANDSSVFLTNIDLADFPYTTFSQIVPGKDAPQSRYPTAWSWILLIHFIASLAKDGALEVPDHDSFEQTKNVLHQMGLLPIMGLPNLVRVTGETAVRVAIPPFFEGSHKQQTAHIDVPYFVENLKRLVLNLRTPNRHVLVLDGLDEIVTTQTAQWESLGALIFEVNRLNASFASSGLDAKVLLLCRTDIFELLEGANKNKIRQDSAIELDWYSNPASPHKSRLVSIADLRATVALNRPAHVLEEFFPEKLFKKKASMELLDSTRHTPRDFLQLLKMIQTACKDGEISPDNIRNGLRKYSIEYFQPEIIDELQGYVSADEAKEFFRLVGSLRQRDFSQLELLECASDENSSLSAEKINIALRALFECSGLGNIDRHPDGQVIFTFRYRNRHAPFNIKQRMLIHRGLWRALNLPVDGRIGSSSDRQAKSQGIREESSARRAPELGGQQSKSRQHLSALRARSSDASPSPNPDTAKRSDVPRRPDGPRRPETPRRPDTPRRPEMPRRPETPRPPDAPRNSESRASEALPSNAASRHQYLPRRGAPDEVSDASNRGSSSRKS